MEPLKIGVLGLGTVASGVASIINKNINEITRRTGQTIIIEAVYVRDLQRDNPYNLPLTTSIDDIITNNEIDVVVELIGGITPAFEFVSLALKHKKHVVTANKELIATHGNELLQMAKQYNVCLGFEAAVAGGIPILKTIREGLAGNTIDFVAGIINGTCNYILSEMSNKGHTFDLCLKEAQELGYAEADPSFDVKGIDAAHKLTILASLSFGIPLSFDQLHIEGIESLTSQQISYANELGYVIKHLGIANKTSAGIELRVHPTLIPKTHMLSQVNGVMNAIITHGNAAGEIFNSGAGAGSEATASAVLADIIDIMQAKHPHNMAPPLSFQLDQIKPQNIIAKSEFQSSYFILLEVNESPDEKAINKLFNQHNIATKRAKRDEMESHLILITEKTVEKNIEKLFNNVMLLECIQNASYIRIEEFS